MGKRVVVLGGVGLIGTHLCLRLLSEGAEVFCVDVRDAADSPLLVAALSQNNFRYEQHNIINSFDIRCDEIYNLTVPSRVRYDRTLPVETLKINVLGAINTLNVARTERARILYASSGNVYGSNITEGSSPNSSKQILAEGKRAGETFHRAYQSEYEMDCRIARIFNTYGTGCDTDDQRVVMKMVVAALRNRDIVIYGSGEQLRTFCWVGDMVDGLIKLMQAPRSELTRTADLGGEHEISIRMLAEKIITLTGSRSQITHTEAHTDDPRRRTPTLTAAKRDLNWAPTTSLTEGLKRTVEYAEHELSRTTWSAKSWVEMNA
ncbi:MAG: NAD-dependent epimerase/dehydratase family protein, partial [Alistipes sp.]